MELWKLCCCFYLVYFVFAKRIDDTRGPFTIKILFFEDCMPPESDSLLKFKLRVRRLNRTAVATSGGMELKFDLNDDIKTRMDVEVYSETGWKQNFFISDFGEKGFCNITSEFIPAVIKRIIQRLHPDVTECPIPAGNYTIRNLETEIPYIRGLSEYPLPYKKYRSSFHFYRTHGGPDIACMAVVSDVVPKGAKKKGQP